MLRLSVIAACAALLIGNSTEAANAGTTGNGMATRASVATRGTVSVEQSGPKVVITLHITSLAAWTYDPASGGMSPIPAQSVDGAPIRGTIVKGGKNPGGNYVNFVADPNGGGFAFPPSMEPGNYNIAITIPANAIPVTQKPAPRSTYESSMQASRTSGAVNCKWPCRTAPTTVTLHVTVDAKGNITVTRGTLPAVMPASATNTQ